MSQTKEENKNCGSDCQYASKCECSGDCKCGSDCKCTNSSKCCENCTCDYTSKCPYFKNHGQDGCPVKNCPYLAEKCQGDECPFKNSATECPYLKKVFKKD